MNQTQGGEHQLPEFPAQRDDSPYASLSEHGAPGGARQHVSNDSRHEAVARPGGATQNSGGALQSHEQEHGPGRGAD